MKDRRRGPECRCYIQPVRPTPHAWRHVATALAALAIVATVLGPTVSAFAAKSSTTTTTLKRSTECTAKQLSLSVTGTLGGVTGEEAFTMAITNMSTEECQIHGYPTVRFYTSAGRLLTFSYAHTSVMFRRSSPRLVNLKPGSNANFVVAKHLCDQGIRYVASFFYVLAPYTSGEPMVEHFKGSGVRPMDYCKGSSRGPGQSLEISPLVTSLSQLGK